MKSNKPKWVDTLKLQRDANEKQFLKLNANGKLRVAKERLKSMKKKKMLATYQEWIHVHKTVGSSREDAAKRREKFLAFKDEFGGGRDFYWRLWKHEETCINTVT